MQFVLSTLSKRNNNEHFQYAVAIPPKLVGESKVISTVDPVLENFASLTFGGGSGSLLDRISITNLFGNRYSADDLPLSSVLSANI